MTTSPAVRFEAQPLVSVVIAAYNCALYVGAAIDSVLAQTYRNVEVHLVNDGSTDNTAAAVARFRGDPRVHYYEQANAGQTRAKNRGIRAARGEFIAFCDADDLWLPDKLALQMPAFHSERVAVVYSRAEPIDQNGRLVGTDTTGRPYVSGRITAALFRSNMIPFGTAVVRRACLQEMGSFDEQYRMGIDWELWLRLSTRYEFQFVDEVTYQYRIWPGQMSNNWRGRYEAAFRIMQVFLDKHPGVLAASVVRDAWADCFVRRARLRALRSGEYGPALTDLARALSFRPTSMEAWKSIAFVLATVAGRRVA